MSNPKELRYSRSHEWVRVEGKEAIVGITNHAQEALGDITYVESPAVGESVKANTECGSIESVKAASDIFSPVTGTIVSVNSKLEATPEVVNQDPYGTGWLFKVTLGDVPGDLLDVDAYEELCKKESH